MVIIRIWAKILQKGPSGNNLQRMKDLAQASWCEQLQKIWKIIFTNNKANMNLGAT